MDTAPARREDDLSEFESRLAGWRPAADTPDAVLFAAGVAVGRGGRGRWAWPAACALLAVQAAVAGGWALSERAARRAAEEQLGSSPRAPGTPPAGVVPTPLEPPYAPSPDDYFHLFRGEQNPTRWLDPPEAGGLPPGPPPPEPPTLRAGRRDGLPDF